ncbi:hypothetical protein CLV30_13128 [Haloactinopolyspora alba]|uniref:Uncharacterized protein n=1 Tax=Haloactinopolyspora alba TaxID=648780 RepID=A0A2P8D735_9ACTN|nr:hypothetical protein [Haloactinopolyspora alba]PSK93001.1 hypothetical protein CLV30_13128 [Haloactinopolyspora alba]
MGNIIRIVVGVGGLVAAGWSAVRSLRARRAGERDTFARAWAILAATAVVMALTLVL